MTAISDIQSGFAEALTYGQQVRIKYYNINYGAGSYFDDDVSLTQSGIDLWTSGLLMPIWSRSRYSSQSDEAVLVQQGKLLLNDSKLFIDGTIPVSGTLKIGLGSLGVSGVTSDEFSVVDIGILNWNINQVPLYRTVYIRRLTNGSLMGE